MIFGKNTIKWPCMDGLLLSFVYSNMYLINKCLCKCCFWTFDTLTFDYLLLGNATICVHVVPWKADPIFLHNHKITGFGVDLCINTNLVHNRENRKQIIHAFNFFYYKKIWKVLRVFVVSSPWFRKQPSIAISAARDLGYVSTSTPHLQTGKSAHCSLPYSSTSIRIDECCLGFNFQVLPHSQIT